VTERSSSSLQLCFFSPLRRHSSPTDAQAEPPFARRVVLVSSRSAAVECGLVSEEWYDIEQDCADCDCACFTSDD
jgi:hypothetical protein